MKLRIAIWTGVGALVAVLWTVFISGTSLAQLGMMSILVYLTCPIALAHHYPLSLYFVLLVNAVTYALIGMAVETTRRHYKHVSLVSS